MNIKSLLIAATALAALPALALAQAHPDFTGAWTITPYTGSLKPMDGKPVPLKPEAKAVYDKHIAAAAKGDKSWDETSICIPEGLPRLMIINEPFEIMQKSNALYFVAQNRLPWRAYFGEKLPTDVDPFYLGYHVAHWEGATLVIDSNGFRDSTVLDDKGLPHSEQMKMTQKLHLAPGGKTMTIDYTIDDPTDYLHPWTARETFVKKPADFQFPEEVCAAKLKSTAPKQAAAKN